MRTLEISARLLAPPHVPRAAVSLSLHLPTLHFPSAKFGERDPPPGRVCLGRERTLFYFIAVRRVELAERGRRPGPGGCGATSPVAPLGRLRLYFGAHRGNILFLKQ